MNPGSSGRNSASLPDTFFAPAKRADAAALRKAIAAASHNSVIDAVLRMFGGIVAVLNKERQILAVNETLLAAMGIEDAGAALGLRPGEAAGCVHAADPPAGCGTGRYCSTCGAAIAIVAAAASGHPEDRECLLTVKRDGRTVDIDFEVRCAPVELGGLPLLLLFMRDITAEKRRGALERTFFHDVNNLLTSLRMAGDMLTLVYPKDDIVRTLRQSILMLVKEVEVQRILVRALPSECHVAAERTSVCQVLDRLRGIYASHPMAVGRFLRITYPPTDTLLVADPGLLLRALMNVVTNALEAAEPKEEVRVSTLAAQTDVTFLVWNRRPIPPDAALRVFQRYFTTKVGFGRGLGAYTVKWLTETYLKGKVDFTSTETEGTTFRLTIPLHL